MRRDRVLIVTAYDDNGHYAKMAEKLEAQVTALKYNFKKIHMTGQVKQSKARLMLNEMYKKNHEWVVWMDADSIMVRQIDEIFNSEWQIGICPKSSTGGHKKFGKFVHSGFISALNVGSSRGFLERWDERLQLPGVHSDQKQLNSMLEPDMGGNLVPGTTVELTHNDILVKWLDPDVYIHQDSIREMVKFPKHVKILHFKGSLHPYFRFYRKHYL